MIEDMFKFSVDVKINRLRLKFISGMIHGFTIMYNKLDILNIGRVLFSFFLIQLIKSSSEHS